MYGKLGIGFGVLLSIALCAGEAAATAARPQGGQALFDQQEGKRRLVESISARERQRASTRREDVAAKVARRAREMGVKAPVALLTDLLLAEAEAQLERDRCTVSGATACDVWQAEIDRLEGSFRDWAGLSMAEFRNGAHLPAVPKLAAAAESTESSCVCSFQVYSKQRWMSGYWGLECHNHDDHSLCSSIPDQDIWHTEGCGAMTGDVAVSTGLQWIGRECPDDHQTCFKGPGFCGFGEWSAVCSCDTWHWPGKSDGESSPEWVYQFTFNDVVLNGLCSQAQFQIIEGIYENDWGCCRDWMGNLAATFTPPAGSFDLTVPTSATKCGENGVCGSFGASLQVIGSCSGPVPPPDGGGGGGGGGCGSHNLTCYPSYRACAEECCGVCERRINCGSETAHKCFE